MARSRAETGALSEVSVLEQGRAQTAHSFQESTDVQTTPEFKQPEVEQLTISQLPPRADAHCNDDVDTSLSGVLPTITQNYAGTCWTCIYIWQGHLQRGLGNRLPGAFNGPQAILWIPCLLICRAVRLRLALLLFGLDGSIALMAGPLPSRLRLHTRASSLVVQGWWLPTQWAIAPAIDRRGCGAPES